MDFPIKSLECIWARWPPPFHPFPKQAGRDLHGVPQDHPRGGGSPARRPRLTSAHPCRPEARPKRWRHVPVRVKAWGLNYRHSSASAVSMVATRLSSLLELLFRDLSPSTLRGVCNDPIFQAGPLRFPQPPRISVADRGNIRPAHEHLKGINLIKTWSND